jgi:methionine synthase II (cobalamin-independent)
MFATLLGALPAPPGLADPAERLAAVLAAQEAAGLEPLTDGMAAAEASPEVLDRWRAASARTSRSVKVVLRGPWTAAIGRGSRRERGSGPVRGSALARDAIATAERLHELVTELAAAGCPLVEIEESEAHRIGQDEAARRAFLEAHLRLARDVAGTHLSLSISGGSAWDAGSATILDAPYHSLAVDLIAGPDNWNLVTRTPGDRGIVAGVLPTTPGSREGPELLVWAAHYAASTRARGLARVGLGSAGGLAHLSWEEAARGLGRLGEAARIATLPQGELAEALDPRAVSIRAGATGRTRHAGARRPGT